MAIKHGILTIEHGIHAPHSFVFNTVDDRLAATFVAGDLYKIALQLDTQELWMLVSLQPINWKSVGVSDAGSVSLNLSGKDETTVSAAIQELYINTAEHSSDTENPHGVTVEQIGALSLLHPASAISGFAGTGSALTVAHSDHNHGGIYEPANINIQSHISDLNNPHSITASQVGAIAISHPANAFSGFAGSGIASTVAHSDHDHVDIYEPANSNIQIHIVDTANPHNVTAEQVQAMPTTHIANSITGFGESGESTFVARADHTHPLDNIAITDTHVVNSEVSMLALTAEKGDVAIRTDLHTSFILRGSSAATLSDWEELLSPTTIGSISAEQINVDPYAGSSGGELQDVLNYLEDYKMAISHPASAISGFAGNGVASTVAHSDHDHAGIYELANTNIQSHISSDKNPHSVTIEQIGALSAQHPASAVSGFAGSGIASTVAHSDHDHAGVYELANSNIQTHITDTENPHGVTIEQIGALSALHPASAVSGFAGSGIASTVAHSDHDHAGIYEAANSNIQTHITDTENPHNVTAEQVGAIAISHPVSAISGFAGSGIASTAAHSDHDHADLYETANSNIQTHITDTENPHGVTALQVGAIAISHPASAISGFAGSGIASTVAHSDHDHADLYETANSNIQAHITDTENPHSVTAQQVGAIAISHPVSAISGFAGSGVASTVAHSDHTHPIEAIAITDTFVVASESAMLALTNVQTGDIAIRTDENKSYILQGTSASTLEDWVQLLSPSTVGLVDSSQITVTPHSGMTAINLQDALNYFEDTKVSTSHPVSEILGFAGSGSALTVAHSDHDHTGIYESANSNIQSHISDTENPHSVTAQQVGAIATSHPANAISGFAGSGSALTVSHSDHDHASVYELANSNIQTHITDTENPHSVTLEQIGALSAQHPASAISGFAGSGIASTVAHSDHDHMEIYEAADINIQLHITDTLNNPHDVTASQVGAIPLSHPAGAISGFAGSGIASTVAHSDHDHGSIYETANSNIQSHISSVENPHSVTIEQIGALSAQHPASAVSGFAGSGIASTVAHSDHDHGSIYELANINIQAHISRTDNPHSISAEQVGAIPLSHPAGAISGFAGSGIASTVAHSDHDHAGIYEAANSNIQTHITDTENPHGVTIEQIGALSVLHPASAISGFAGNGVASTVAHSDHDHAGIYEAANSNIQTHITDTENPHNVTAEQVGAIANSHPVSAISGFAGSGIASTVAHSDHDHGATYEAANTNIQLHILDVENPHGVTATQAGAVSIDAIGAVSGVAPLDANAKIPLANMNDALLGNVHWSGTWAASTNIPTLPVASSENKGQYYVCSNSGTQFGISFVTGDWVISNGTAWEKVDNTDAVSTVFNRTGYITAQNGDYTASQITNAPSGSIGALTVQEAINELDLEKEPLISNLPVTKGGVGVTSYTIGDLLYASGATTLSKLPSVATGNTLLAGGVGTAPSWGKLSLTTHVSGVLPVANGGTGANEFSGFLFGNGSNAVTALTAISGSAISGNISGNAANVTGIVATTNGGTGQSSYAVGDLLYAGSTSSLSKLADVATGSVLVSGGINTAPSWSKVGLTTHVSGTLSAANGGTGQTSYGIGDLLYADSGSTLSKLADVATGNVLVSGGVGVAPSWGKVGLTTHVSGTLSVTNGGTGQTAYTVGDLLYANSTSGLTKLADVATGSVLISGGVNTAPSWGKVGLTTHISGTLPIANGGTGQTTYTTNQFLLYNGTGFASSGYDGNSFAAASSHPHAELTNATSDNTNGTLVKRGTSGEFSAGLITADLNGTAYKIRTSAPQTPQNGDIWIASA